MSDDEELLVKDAVGNRLQDDDSVSLIKDLKVKGSSQTLKRGTVYKIRLTNNTEELDCTGKHRGLVLKACFVKKA